MIAEDTVRRHKTGGRGGLETLQDLNFTVIDFGGNRRRVGFGSRRVQSMKVILIAFFRIVVDVKGEREDAARGYAGIVKPKYEKGRAPRRWDRSRWNNSSPSPSKPL